MITYFIKIGHYFKLSQETLFMSVRLFDKICSMERMTSSNKLLFFIASIHLSCKFEESKYYKIESFIDMFGENMAKTQVILAEERILKLVNYQIGIHNPYDFLKRLS